MKLKVLLIIIFIVLSYISSYGQKSVISREYPSMVTSVRALGMGGAYFAISNDKYAAFYNPAGLAMNNSEWNFDIPVTIGANNYILSNGTTLVNTALVGSITTYTFSELLNMAMGKYYNITPVGFFPAFTYKNFSFGLFFNGYTNIVAYNNVIPTISAKAHADTGAVATYAHSFLEDKSLHVGISLIGFYRNSYTATYNIIQMSELDTNELQTDVASGHTWGIMASIGSIYELPWLKKELNPRVGLSLNNVGYMEKTKNTDQIVPTLNLGLAISPGWSFISSNIALDFNDLLFMNGSDKSFGKRINFGGEVGFWDRLFLRLGLHQGYITAGVGVNVWAVRINYAYYTEELGASVGQYGDKRHVLELVLGWDQPKQPDNNLDEDDYFYFDEDED